MKKHLLFIAEVLVVAGCSSAARKDDGSDVSLRKDAAKYQIIDQEFDNVLAPDGDYDVVPPYEEQISSSSYLQSVKGSRKPAKKTVTKTSRTVVSQDGKTITTVNKTEVQAGDSEPVPPSPVGEQAN